MQWEPENERTGADKKKRRAKFYVLASCCAVAANTIPEVCVDADVEVRSGRSATSIILQRRNLFRTLGCRGQLSSTSHLKSPLTGHPYPWGSMYQWGCIGLQLGQVAARWLTCLALPSPLCTQSCTDFAWLHHHAWVHKTAWRRWSLGSYTRPLNEMGFPTVHWSCWWVISPTSIVKDGILSFCRELKTISSGKSGYNYLL